MRVKKSLSAMAALLWLASTPATAQIFSWGPLNAVQEVLPGGAPSESEVIQARLQIKEVAQHSLASLYEINPASRRAIERSAGYAVFSTFGIKLLVAGGTTGKGN